jgi:ribosomal protein L40E
MNMVTACCKAEVTNKHTLEYPLNDAHSISFNSSICIQCLAESPEMVQLCDNCGNFDHLMKTKQGDICSVCISTLTWN